MSDARTAILDAIRKDKHGKGGTEAATLEQRIREHARGPHPDWQEDRVARLVNKLEQAAATYVPLESRDEVPREVADYIERSRLDGPLVSASTSALKGIDWPPSLRVNYRAAEVQDRLVLTEACCGIAETGSLVLLSGPDTPTSVNFLTDHFLCVLRVDRIVDTIEDVWQRMREEDTAMPRAINFVTGPSRTADVEQTIQLGAHGPRYVHVLLLEH